MTHSSKTAKWGCRTCGKRVHPKDGKLSCCGITETLGHASLADRVSKENLRRKLASTLNSIGDKWRDR